jgi:hypothetical protein
MGHRKGPLPVQWHSAEVEPEAQLPVPVQHKHPSTKASPNDIYFRRRCSSICVFRSRYSGLLHPRSRMPSSRWKFRKLASPTPFPSRVLQPLPRVA